MYKPIKVCESARAAQWDPYLYRSDSSVRSSVRAQLRGIAICTIRTHVHRLCSAQKCARAA
jgi:hypothetical protein